MNKKDLAETKLKLESAYFQAKIQAPLSLLSKLLSHKERHNVMLRNVWTNKTSGTEFIQSITKSLGNNTKNKIENSNFYSWLTDAFTDSSVTEQEAFFVMTFDPNPIGNKNV